MTDREPGVSPEWVPLGDPWPEVAFDIMVALVGQCPSDPECFTAGTGGDLCDHCNSAVVKVQDILRPYAMSQRETLQKVLEIIDSEPMLPELDDARWFLWAAIKRVFPETKEEA